MTVLGIGLSAVILGRAGPADRTRRRPGDRRGHHAADVADLDLREARLGLRRALAHATTTRPTHHRPLIGRPGDNPLYHQVLSVPPATVPDVIDTPSLFRSRPCPTTPPSPSGGQRRLRCRPLRAWRARATRGLPTRPPQRCAAMFPSRPPARPRSPRRRAGRERGGAGAGHGAVRAPDRRLRGHGDHPGAAAFPHPAHGRRRWPATLLRAPSARLRGRSNFRTSGPYCSRNRFRSALWLRRAWCVRCG